MSMRKFTPHERHSIRLKDRDYSKPGAYFITICAYRYGMSFDEPEIYRAIESEWFATTKIRSNIGMDEFVIMPNHVHGIIVIKSYYKSVGAYGHTPLHLNNNVSSLNNKLQENKLHSPSQTIGAIIRGFKGATTLKVNIWRQFPGFPLWQRNYYEYVIRNEAEFAAYRKYIRENPANWDKDVFNPVNFRNGKRPQIPAAYR
jgi:putative transposase